MYIAPHTNIRLLRGCPLDPQYVNSVAFLSQTIQTNYFIGLTKYNLNNYSYQRYDKGVLRVQILSDNLYDVNYMMFQNTAFGNKWFYAFIDSIEYVNNVTSEIRYHIDEIQTWLFDWDFNTCFIERMHTPTDEVGDNITVEPLEVGEYVYNNYTDMNEYGEKVIIVAIADVDENDELVARGYNYDGIYGACELFAFKFTSDGINGVNDLINKYSKSPDSVVSIYMCPKYYIDPTSSYNQINVYSESHSYIPITDGATGVGQTKTLGSLDGITTVDGHTVRNKKLLTYPYNFMNIVNGEGNNLALRYEFAKEKTVKVNMRGNITQPVQMVAYPTDYKNVNKPEGQSTVAPCMVDEKIVLASFPMCSWNVDTWKAWVTQNATPILISAVTAASTIALTAYNPAVTAEVGTGVADAMGKEMMITKTTPSSFTPKENSSIYSLHSVSNLLTNAYKASIAADQTKGTISSGNVAYANNLYRFFYGRISVNNKQAEIIDSFFDRFGYAINSLGKPSIRNRPAWTYVKTIGCTIDGTIPVDSEHEIENIFNNGITFWTNPLYVCDYTRNNQPIT